MSTTIKHKKNISASHTGAILSVITVLLFILAVTVMAFVEARNPLVLSANVLFLFAALLILAGAGYSYINDKPHDMYGITGSRLLSLIVKVYGGIIVILLLLLWAAMSITPRMNVNTLYGITLHQPFAESHIKALTEKGTVVSTPSDNSLWDYRLINPSNPNTTISLYLDKATSQVLRIEAATRFNLSETRRRDELKNGIEHYQFMLDEARTLYTEMASSLEQKQNWPWWADLALFDFRDFPKEQHNGWQKFLPRNMPVGDHKTRSLNSQIWTDGDTTLWISAVWIMDTWFVVLQDSSALNAQFQAQASETVPEAQAQAVAQKVKESLTDLHAPAHHTLDKNKLSHHQ